VFLASLVLSAVWCLVPRQQSTLNHTPGFVRRVWFVPPVGYLASLCLAFEPGTPWQPPSAWQLVCLPICISRWTRAVCFLARLLVGYCSLSKSRYDS